MSNGYLMLILGPMFSGKSTKLIQYINKYKTLNKQMLIIKPSLDNRYITSANICTHDMQTQSCICIDKDKLNTILNDDQYINSQIIIIEEGQFFENLHMAINQMLIDKKTIYISALNGDSNQELFGEIYKLIPICDNIVKLTSLCSICRNGTKAIFSMRITDETTQTLIGNST